MRPREACETPLDIFRGAHSPYVEDEVCPSNSLSPATHAQMTIQRNFRRLRTDLHAYQHSGRGTLTQMGIWLELEKCDFECKSSISRVKVQFRVDFCARSDYFARKYQTLNSHTGGASFSLIIPYKSRFWWSSSSMCEDISLQRPKIA